MSASPDKESHETLEGSVSYVVFAAEDTDFVVARFETEEGLTTIAGPIGPLEEHAPLKLHGQWGEHPRFGKQFQAEWAEVTTPSTLSGMKKYLGSGIFPGIGPDLADKLVDHFKEDTLDALHEGKRLREVPGVGPKRAQTLMEGFVDSRDRHRVLAELRGLALTASQANLLYEKWQAGAIDRAREDPYHLIDLLKGFGFRTAEKIAVEVGIPRDSTVRARGVLLHLLREAARQGHACLPEAHILEQLAQAGVSGENILLGVQELAENNRLRLGGDGDERMHYLPELWNAEIGLSQHIHRLLSQSQKALASHDNIESAILRTAYAPDESQRLAIEMALDSPFSVLTGGPGTGKTTTLRLLLEILASVGVEKVHLASPTGRAAKRLQEATSKKASTVHRLLGFDPIEGGFRHNEDDPLEADYLIIDEASMLDLSLACSLLRAVPDHCRVLFVGDADQLPSVGPGSVLRDLVASPEVATTRLARIHRQGAGSGIVDAAHAILAGHLPQTTESDGAGDFFLSLSEDPEQAAAMVEKIVCERIPKRYGLDPMQDVLVLSPMYRGALGVNELNERLAQALNPESEGPDWARGFREGDRVMVIRNDYEREVFNGDQGLVVALEDGVATVQIDGKLHQWNSGELDDIIRSYCVTVHRSQGSEAPAVVMVVDSSHFMMLRRNLVYTAVTRGKQLVVLVAHPRALAQAVRNADENLRHGRLQERLRQARLA